jgi:synaptojanin
MASQPAFERHFSQLLEEYSAVYGVNLLGSKENEAVLTSAYSQHLKQAKANGGLSSIGLTQFDFHSLVRLNGLDSLNNELR